MTVHAKRLRFRIVASSLLFCLIPMLSIALYSHNTVERDLITMNESHLHSILELKKSQIRRFFQRATNDIHTIATSPFVLEILENAPSSPLKHLTQDQIEQFIEKRNLQDVTIFDAKHHKIFSTTPLENSIENLHLFHAKCSKDEDDKSKIAYDKTRKMYYLLECHPIISKTNVILGHVVATVNVTPLFVLMQDYSGLGESGETLLGEKREKSLLFLNPLRHDTQEALQRVISLNKQKEDIATPLFKGVSGENGSGVSSDYRGVKVVASWGFIPEVSWGIVAKIDYSEVVKPLDALKLGLTIASTLFLIFSILFAWYIAYYLAAPMQKIESDALTDSLTHLPNRAALMQELSQMLERHKEEKMKFAVLFLDLDGFKAVNDTYGHEVGDELLKSVATRLSSVVKTQDFVSRLGGDEFVVLLTHIPSVEHVYTIAQRINNKINEAFAIRHLSLHVGTSIGVSLFPDDGLDSDTLLFLADKAMYDAKSSGKNTIQFAKKL